MWGKSGACTIIYYSQSGEFDEGLREGQRGGKGHEGFTNLLLPLLRHKYVAFVILLLQRPSDPTICLGACCCMQTVVRTLRVRCSSLPCARQNGRAFSSLTARGGGGFAIVIAQK